MHSNKNSIMLPPSNSRQCITATKAAQLAPMPQVDCFYYLKNVALKAMTLDCKKGTS